MGQYCRELEEEIMYLQKAIVETTNSDDLHAIRKDLEDLRAALKYAAPILEEESEKPF